MTQRLLPHLHSDWDVVAGDSLAPVHRAVAAPPRCDDRLPSPSVVRGPSRCSTDVNYVSVRRDYQYYVPYGGCRL
jgi:hypothetical protein